MKRSYLAKRILSQACFSFNKPGVSPGSRLLQTEKNSFELFYSRLVYQHFSRRQVCGFTKGQSPLSPAVRLSLATPKVTSPFYGNSPRRSVSTLPPAGSLPDNIRYILYGILLVGCAATTYYFDPSLKKVKEPEEAAKDEEHITNWSNTHEAHPKYYYQPESLEDLQRVVRLSHLTSRKIRPVGSGLSPNGIAFSDEGMLNMALMDRVLVIDTKLNQVTVQAGARIDQVVDAIKPYGLTLENYASIKEQQVGGFTQVGAHGTGAGIPSVDERVVRMKLVTPTEGTVELSAESSPDLFYLARCGLGTLGVVAEVTLQCVPAYRLVERTFLSNMKEVRKNHKKWLKEYKHLRYMWLPHMDAVVVVQSNPLPEGQKDPKDTNRYDQASRMKAMQELHDETIRKHLKDQPKTDNKPPAEADVKAGAWTGTAAGSREAAKDELLTFPALRDKVLALDPLNPEHIKRVNKAEVEFWKRSEGIRVGWSNEILSFDCGGQQWVSEVCFPAGTLDEPDMSDIKFMEELLELVKKHNIPAPGPIEQRWTSSSRSVMSPAYDPSPDRLFSWVGIIMYMPTEDAEQRKAITERFFEYRRDVQKQLWDAYGAYEHWAKVEIRDNDEAEWTRERLKKRFAVEDFSRARIQIDPKNIFGNDFIDTLFPRHRSLEEV